MKIIARDKKHLENIIKKEMQSKGNQCDLNHIDISNIQDLSYLFWDSPFNGDISKWNTSNVVDMECMFECAIFNGDISNWDVSKVRVMTAMFQKSDFNGDISNWDVTGLKDICFMFINSAFSGDISQWKPINLIDTLNAFLCSASPTPYWLDCDKDERKKIIEAYHLNKELDSELNNSQNICKKLKI
jgi:hypothetical protein